MASPTISEVRKGYCNILAAMVATAAFTNIINTVSPKIYGKCCTIKVASSNMPIETKKKLLNISRNGIILLVAWWLYSDSEIISPAIKAPSANDKPNREVSQATAKQITTTLKINNSRLLVWATW